MASILTHGLLCLLLAWASVADKRWRRIPNPCTVGGSTALIAMQAAAGVPLAGRLAMGLATFIPLASISLLRPAALGMGDVKLVSLIALAIGPLVLGALAAGCVSALAACGAGLVVRGRDRVGDVTVAMAPHLAVGAIVAVALVE